MKKYIFLGIGLLVGVFILSIISILISHSHSSNQTIQTTTPTPIQVNNPVGTHLSLRIEKTQPDDGQKDIPTTRQIVVTFNRLFSPEEFTFGSWPIFSYTTTINGKDLIITPNQPLQKNTIYTYYITYKNPIASETRTFATIGNNPTAPSTYVRTGSPQDPYNGNGTPDLYLSNRTPYTGTTFSVNHDFTSTPKDHFFFTVMLTGSDKSQDKQDFITWLTSLGFSTTIIQGLDIRYQ